MLYHEFTFINEIVHVQMVSSISKVANEVKKTKGIIIMKCNNFITKMAFIKLVASNT